MRIDTINKKKSPIRSTRLCDKYVEEKIGVEFFSSVRRTAKYAVFDFHLGSLFFILIFVCLFVFLGGGGGGGGAQSVLVNSEARVMHTAWHPDQSSRALMSLSSGAGTSGSGKNFALHLHAGLRV